MRETKTPVARAFCRLGIFAVVVYREAQGGTVAKVPC